MKTFFKSIIGIVVICILGGVVFLFLAWSRVPDMVSSNLSKTLKVGVEIGDIHFGMNQLTVDKFVIDNPRGFTLPKAFGVDEIAIKAPVLNYLRDDIEINEITLDNVYIGLEFDSTKGTNGNWTVLMGNAQKSQDANKATQKSVMIKRIVLNNINTDLLYHTDGKVRHLPVIKQIVLTNVSSKGGNISDQLMNSALGQMIKEVFIQENLKDLMDQIFQLPGTGNPVQDAIQQFKGFFNTTPGLCPPSKES
jgi:hypothetical protein